MKAYLEVVRMNIADVITTSPTTPAPCGDEYTPEISVGCTDPEWDS